MTPRPLLLWTERPVLLPREYETHEWMKWNTPWVELGLDLVFDNAPGDWRHYCAVFKATWKRAREAGVAFINLESDIVPTIPAFRSLLTCPELVCTVPYVVYGYNDAQERGYSAVIEKHVPGGWDCRLARPGDEWAVSCDLGLVRYGPSLLRAMPETLIPDLPADNGLLHEGVAKTVRRVTKKAAPIHLHWPGIRNNHVYWDDGDQRHHPPGFKPVAGMLRPEKAPTQA